MLRTATPVHGPHPRFTTAARLLLVCAVVVAVLGVAPEADAAVLASVKNGTLTVKGGNAAERSRFGPALPGSSWWTSATTARPTSRSAAPRSRGSS